MSAFTAFLLLPGFLLTATGFVLRRKNSGQAYRTLLPAGIALTVILAFAAWFMPAFIFQGFAGDEIEVTLYSQATGPYEISGAQKEEFLACLRTAKFRREFLESQELFGTETYYHAIMYDGRQHYNLNLYVSPDGSSRLLQADTQKYWLRQVYRATNPDLLSQCMIRLTQDRLLEKIVRDRIL